jgi:sRNA-binding protein
MKPAAAVNLLIERYPLCFFALEQHRKPLKLRIFHDLLAAGVMPEAEVAMALRYYCRNMGYLRASKPGAARIDLEGNVAAEVSAEQAAHARKQLANLVERQAARAKAKRDYRASKRDAAAMAPDVPPVASRVPAATVAPTVSIAPPTAPVASPPAAPVRVVVTAPRTPGRRLVLSLPSPRKRA